MAKGDRAKDEHYTIAKVIQFAMEFDQLNITELVAFEWLLLRQQTLEQAYQNDPLAPTYDNQEKWMGTSRREDASLINPERRKALAEELRDEASILKETRKAREEARLAKEKK